MSNLTHKGEIIMQNDITIDKLSEEDLRAVTGGCATCAGLRSIALRESERAVNNVANNPGTNAANREWTRARKLRALAGLAQEGINRPVLQGCDHCGQATALTKQIGKRITSR
jgi:hypothetical protein